MKFGLIGTFDVDNFGDCMFPELYRHFIFKRYSDASICLYSPTSTAASILSFDRVYALPSSISDIGEFSDDVLLLIGGETVGVGHSSGTFNFPRNTLSAYLRLWLIPVAASVSEEGRPFFFGAHAVGAIKMPTYVSELVAKVLAGASYCTFRDEFSVSWIRSDTVSFPRGVDPMFMVDELLTGDAWSELAMRDLPLEVRGQGYIAAQMSYGYGKNDIEGWARAVAEIARARNLHVVLIPICHFLHDEIVLKRALHFLQEGGASCYLLGGRRNVKVTAAIIGSSSGYVGSSLHGAVTAVSFGKPVAVLGHSLDGKHEGSLRSVGMPGAVAISVGELPACFARTESMDMGAIRQFAHGLALGSLESLFKSIDLRRDVSLAERQRALSSAIYLSELERKGVPFFSFYEIKRFLLRSLKRIPKVEAAYHRFRMELRLR